MQDKQLLPKYFYLEMKISLNILLLSTISILTGWADAFVKGVNQV